MPYAIELLFDDASTTAITAVQTELYRQRVATECAHTPHISLTVCEEVNAPIFKDVLAEFARHTTPFTLTLSHLGVFLPGVVFLGVTVPRQLLTLHNDFHYDFIQYATNVWDYYTPAQWVPHCTLADKLALEAVPQAVALCQSMLQLPLQVAIQNITLLDVSTKERLEVFPLRGLYETGIEGD